MMHRTSAGRRLTDALDRVPLLFPAAAFTAGATAEMVWRIELPAALCVGVIIGAAMWLMHLRRGVWALVAAIAGVSVAWPEAHESFPDDLLERSAYYVATIQTVRVGHGGVTLECRVDSAAGRAVVGRPRIAFTLLSQERVPEPGQTVRFAAQLEAPVSATELPDELDYSAFYRSRGVLARGMLPRDSLKSVSGTPDWGARVRAGVEGRIMRLPLQPDTRAFLGAVLAGSDELIQPEVRTRLSEAGVAHVLALSGLHVGIIAMILGALLFPLQMSGHRKARMACIICGIWFFAVATGCAASVMRAAVMATVILLGRMLERDSSPLNALCAAAIIVVGIWPRAVLSMGAQMSFAAAASIVLFMPAIYALNMRRRLIASLFGYIGASCAAMMSAGAVSLFYFHTFPVYFLLGNVAAAIPLAPFLCIGIVDLIVSAVMPLPALLAAATDFLYRLIYGTADAVASLPGATIDNAYFPAWLFVPMALAWLALVMAVRLPSRKFGVLAVGMAVLTALCFVVSRPDYPDRETYLTANLRHTTIVDRRADTLRLVTAADPQHHREVEARARKLYADYCGRRGVDTIIVSTDSVVVAQGCRYALINGRYQFPAPADGITVAVVATGFKGDIAELVERVRSDTVVLGRDLNRRRSRRYHAECEALGVPVREL